MPDTTTDTQHNARPSTEGGAESVTITLFGRLALLRSQIDAGLDDETCDRQYLLEQASAELARTLDTAAPATGGPALAAEERAELLTQALYIAPWANLAVRVAVRPGQAPNGGPAVVVTTCRSEADGPGIVESDADLDESGPQVACPPSSARALAFLLLGAADLAEHLPEPETGKALR